MLLGIWKTWKIMFKYLHRKFITFVTAKQKLAQLQMILIFNPPTINIKWTAFTVARLKLERFLLITSFRRLKFRFCNAILPLPLMIFCFWSISLITHPSNVFSQFYLYWVLSLKSIPRTWHLKKRDAQQPSTFKIWQERVAQAC